MEKTIVAVGRTGRPKLNAVSEALKTFALVLDPGAQFEVVGLEVESGVGHTPATCGELMLGARQRADALVENAREKGAEGEYFVGLEGDGDGLEESGNRRVFLESWAYVTHGKRGDFGRAGG